MLGAVPDKQALVVGSGCFGKRVVGHVLGVGVAAGGDERRLVDEVHPVGGAECHQANAPGVRTFPATYLVGDWLC